MGSFRGRRRWMSVLAAAAVAASALAVSPSALADVSRTSAVAPKVVAPNVGEQPAGVPALIPQPNHLLTVGGSAPVITSRSVIMVLPRDRAARAVGEQFAAEIEPAMGFGLRVGMRAAGADQGATIRLAVDPAADLPEEGYHLTATGHVIDLTASTADGLYRGTTTLRQLLGSKIGSKTAVSAAWSVPSVDITDAPRYAFRGAMLDVGRRFFPVPDVLRFIDQIALYKYNVLHLHLTDDQGWRIAIDALPELTTIGASTQSGWKPGTGGPWFYTAADYRTIIKYAAARHIEVLPEIDGPGHTTAAQASVPGLTCSGTPAAPYSGFDVGLPPVCMQPPARPAVAAYLTTVLQSAAAQSSSSIVHIGGDEVPSITAEQFDWYVKTASAAVAATQHRVMGWVQIAKGGVSPGTILQWWGDEGDQQTIGTGNESEKIQDLRAGLQQEAQIVASPADRAYLDMKYDASVPYGLSWAGLVDLHRAYEWDPVSSMSRPDGSAPIATEADVYGVEAALWADRAYYGSTKLPTSLDQFIPVSKYSDFMTFPRLPAIAEIGWSAPEQHNFSDFQKRIVEQAALWEAMGIDFYHSPDVPWRD